ncbi:YbaK/EbsC family protein [Aliivibrio fischeri]|uniref:YbaK/EbsC family protein n=1 Tax=Aliivibrio fischeri TaxID=668 RepID=UPI00080E7A65|nr:YbaK/EbsC family protein [Aliivibrio fischeri]OCH38080.1 hypothetical protein A6E02_18160 [Aliivibrio fischeri]
MESNNIKKLFEENINLFLKLGIDYEKYTHKAITNYETDLEVSKQFGWTAAPSKSLFLKSKKGNCYLFLTHRDVRLDSKRIKDITGERVSVCSNDELISLTGFIPGAVCPFIVKKDITIIFDGTLLEHKQIMFTPADPTCTLIIKSEDIVEIFEYMENKIHFYSNQYIKA